jgi:2-phospho-L-lactate transferase/gluconeogenesis factor (CofD/UPF0052 family)
VATQHGETDGFTVGDHLAALQRHAGDGIVTAVVANNNIGPQLPESWQSAPVKFRKNGHSSFGRTVRLVEADVVAPENRYRHDPDKLAAIIFRVYDERNRGGSQGAEAASEAPVLAAR